MNNNYLILNNCYSFYLISPNIVSYFLILRSKNCDADKFNTWPRLPNVTLRQFLMLSAQNKPVAKWEPLLRCSDPSVVTVSWDKILCFPFQPRMTLALLHREIPCIYKNWDDCQNVKCILYMQSSKILPLRFLNSWINVYCNGKLFSFLGCNGIPVRGWEWNCKLMP